MDKKLPPRQEALVPPRKEELLRAATRTQRRLLATVTLARAQPRGLLTLHLLTGSPWVSRGPAETPGKGLAARKGSPSCPRGAVTFFLQALTNPQLFHHPSLPKPSPGHSCPLRTWLLGSQERLIPAPAETPTPRCPLLRAQSGASGLAATPRPGLCAGRVWRSKAGAEQK